MIRARATVAVAMCCIAVAVMADRSRQRDDAPTPVVFGVLRGDGVILPFAQYDSGAWSKPWPEADGPPKPLSAETRTRFAAPTSWSIWPLTDRRETLTAAPPKLVGAHCEAAWGLQTDFAWRDVMRAGGISGNGIGLVGVASTGVDAVQRFSPYPEDPLSDRQRLAAFVTPELERNEAAIASPAARAGGSIVFATDPVRVRLPTGQSLIHVEAMRSLHGSRPDTCGGHSIMSTWLLEDAAGALTFVSHEYHFTTDCRDRKDVAKVMPMAMVTLDGRTFLFTMLSGWESGVFAVLEFRDKAIRPIQEWDAGGC